MALTQTVDRGNSVILSVSDPDNVKLHWQTDATNIIFSNADAALTAVAFPYTDIELIITLVATGNKGIATQHDILLTVQESQLFNCFTCKGLLVLIG